MGYYLSIVAAVLDHKENQFVQRNQVLQFWKPIFVSWSRPVAETIQVGWIPLAEETLRAKYQPEDIAEEFEYSTNPVYPHADSGFFDYAKNFALPSHSALFHLLLPPRWLPLQNTIKPFPTYARFDRERFLIGWSCTSSEWFRFTFKEIDPNAFSAQAIELERHVINGQIDNLRTIEDRASLERQLRTWHGNRRYLEEQVARHGGILPLWLYNDLEDTKKQIDALEARLSRLPKW